MFRLFGKSQTRFPGAFVDDRGGYPAGFKVHGVTTMGCFLIPGDEVVSAVSAVYHGILDGSVKIPTFVLRHAHLNLDFL